MRSLVTLLIIVLSTTAFAQHKQLVPYRKGDLWGYADEKKNLVIQPKFEKAGFFREDDNLYYAEGQLNGQKILIQEDGTHVADEFSSDDGEWMDLGMEIEWYQEAKDDPSLVKKGKNGFELKDGVLRKAPAYDDWASDFFNDYTSAIPTLKDSKKKGVATNKGDIMIPFEYDAITCIDRKDLVFAAQKGGRWIILDSRNKRIGDKDFTELSRPSDDRILVRNESGYGFLDTKGSIIISLKYSKAGSFGDDPANTGFAWVSDRGFEFFIDVNGVEFAER